MKRQAGQKQAGNPYYRIPRQPCKNNSNSLTIPAFGLVAVVGTEAGTGALIVDQPTANGQACYVNTPIPIAPGGYGVVTKSWPIWAAYNTGATPSVGQTWGAAAGSYLLTSGQTGFSIDGAPVSGRVLVSAGGGGGGSTPLTQYTGVLSYTTPLAAYPSFTSLSGYSLTLNGQYILTATVVVALSASASGLGTEVQIQLKDSAGNVWGTPAHACYATAASSFYRETVTIQSVIDPGGSSLTFIVQGSTIFAPGDSTSTAVAGGLDNVSGKGSSFWATPVSL